MPASIDILLATFNGAEYLVEQLDSLFAQSCRDWRLIIRDDASSDATLVILKRYHQQHPDKIRLLQDNLGNVGIRENFNLLMQHCTAPYVMFCDQDDIWLPHKIHSSLQLMQATEQANPATPILIHTDLCVINQQAKLLDNSFWHYQNLNPKLDTLNRLLMQNCITGCSMMINRALLAIAHPIPRQCIMHDWWLGLVATAFGKIAFLHSPDVSYRQHARNDTGAKHWSWQYIFGKILATYNIRPTQVQAATFYTRFSAQLSDAQKQLLDTYIHIHLQTWWRRRLQLIKYRLFKQGTIRNLGLFFRI